MYIITGGAGFIGSALLWQLNNRGINDILVVDNLGESSKWRNLIKRSYLDYIHRDKFISLIRNKAFNDSVTAIIHLGACSSTTENNVDFLMENNFHYSRDLCAFALEKGIKFINASSAATYGAGEYGFKDDLAQIPNLRPLNMYGYSKQLFDLWLLRKNLTQKVVSLKFFNVYGPNEYHKGSMQSVAVKIFKEISETGKAKLFASNTPTIGDGEQKRDFIYVKDCVKVIDWLLFDKPKLNGIYNVGTGTARTFNDLAHCVFSILNIKENIEYIEIPANISQNYQNYTCADMHWLDQNQYPFKISSLEKGIEDYVANYLVRNNKHLQHDRYL